MTIPWIHIMIESWNLGIVLIQHVFLFKSDAKAIESMGLVYLPTNLP